MHFADEVAPGGGADLKLGLEAVDGGRHTSGYSICQPCSENKRPPHTKTRRLLRELDGHCTALAHIENLQTDEMSNSIYRP